MWKDRTGARSSVAIPLALILLGLIPTPGSSTGDVWDEQSLARVDGEAITRDDLEGEIIAMSGRIDDPTAFDLPSAEAVLRRMIQNRLLEQEGYRRGDDSTSTIRTQVKDMIRHKSMIALLDSVAGTAPEPDMDHLDTLLSADNKMLRVSHILVDNRAVALSLLDSLSAGVDFSDLVLRHSLDSTTVARGGDLGWARDGTYIPSFGEALAELSPGETSGPVQSERGWHLLMLSDTRTETVGQSEEMKRALIKRVSQEAGIAAIQSYLAALREKYDVEVNDTLLASLDYASADPEIQEHLRTSDEVLTVLPTGRLTVRGLTRKLRFRHFHGLEGKPEAPQARDKMFDEWISEALLIHEASELGMDRRPEILRSAKFYERELQREATLELILDFPFEPASSDVKAYYESHEDQLMPAPRVKVRAAVFETEAVAAEFRRGIEEGGAFGWLVERTKGVVDPEPKSFSGWLDPRSFGNTDAPTLQKQKQIGPFPIPEGWVVAEVTAVERVKAPPLEDCRNKVLQLMKGERSREVLQESMKRLENAAEIEINPEAETIIARRLEEWKASKSSQAGESLEEANQPSPEERK